MAQTQQSRPEAALRRRLSTRYGQHRASTGTIPVAVTATDGSVALVRFTGSPPFDVDGVVSVAQCGRTVNIGDLSQGSSVAKARSPVTKSSIHNRRHPEFDACFASDELGMTEIS
jgi:hypothetical protein